jgi:hypothetical protein
MHMKAAFLCLSDNLGPYKVFLILQIPFPKVSQLTDSLGTFKVGIFANKTVAHCANLYRVIVKIYY